MRDLYLRTMGIPVWRSRIFLPTASIFYRLNNAKNKTIAWIIADDVGEEALLIKIANALTPTIYKENALVLEDAQCLILLGDHVQATFSTIKIKTIITASQLSSSSDYKKALWEKLKPLRVLFDA